MLGGINGVGALGGLGKLTNDVSRFIKPRGFPAGTLVSTEHGLRPIEEIRAGDSVWAFNLAAAQWQLQSVLETYQFDDFQKMTSIRLADETIESTAGHPFWVIEGEDLDSRPRPEHILEANVPDAIVPGRWVDSHDLRPGDVLLLKDRKPTRVLEVTCRPWTGRVYNFAVDDLACYAVGASGLLVHNNCGVELHHSDPIFLGGNPKQKLTPIERNLHRGAGESLHNDLNDFLRTRTNELGQHMRPQRGNPGAIIQENFTREERLDALAEFYRHNSDRYPDVARDFFEQHPDLQ